MGDTYILRVTPTASARSAATTRPETSGSGPIAGPMMIKNSGCSGGVHGTTSRSSPVVLSATGASRTNGTTTSDFVGPGLKNKPLDFNPLTLCFVGFP